MSRLKLKLEAKDIGDIENVEAIFHSKVVRVGNGAMVQAYKKYLDMDAVVIILVEDPREKEDKKRKGDKQ